MHKQLSILPYVLHGHKRPVSETKFNNDGDFLVCASADSYISKWWSSDGKPAGTFEGHEGAVWAVDITSV
jgi:translation initiation factor 3 subunit I